MNLVGVVDQMLAEMERSKARDAEEIENVRKELEECRDRVRQMVKFSTSRFS